MQAPWIDTHAHLYLTASYAMFRGHLHQEEVEQFFDYTAMALQRAEQQGMSVARFIELYCHR